jgi:hypothetical protein
MLAWRGSVVGRSGEEIRGETESSGGRRQPAGGPWRLGDHAIAAGAFGPVKRRIGPRQQLFDGVDVPADRRYADADGDSAAIPGSCNQAVLDRMAQSLGDGDGSSVIRFGQQHDEFVTAEP